jgi:hypothetical protein
MTMDDLIDVGHVYAECLDGGEHSDLLLTGRRQNLVGAELAGAGRDGHDVGKRPSDVDADPPVSRRARHLRTLRSSLE